MFICMLNVQTLIDKHYLFLNATVLNISHHFVLRIHLSLFEMHLKMDGVL